MDSAKSMLESVLRTAVSYIIIAVSNLLIAFGYLYTSFPETVEICLVVVAAYVFFKCFMRIFRLWWRMFKFMIKAVLLFSVLIIATFAYFRGFHRFFTRDIPFLYNCWRSFKEHSHLSVNTELDPAALTKGAAGWIAENVEQIDTLKTGIRSFVSENLYQLHWWAKSQNLQDFNFYKYENN